MIADAQECCNVVKQACLKSRGVYDETQAQWSFTFWGHFHKMTKLLCYDCSNKKVIGKHNITKKTDSFQKNVRALSFQLQYLFNIISKNWTKNDGKWIDISIQKNSCKHLRSRLDLFCPKNHWFNKKIVLILDFEFNYDLCD